MLPRALAVVLVLHSISASATAPSTNSTIGNFTIVWDVALESLTVTHSETSHIVFATPSLPFIVASTTAWTVSNYGNWGKQDKNGGLDMYDGVPQFIPCPHTSCVTPQRTINQTVDSATSNGTSFIISGTFSDVPGLSYTMTFTQAATSHRDLQFVIQIEDSQSRTAAEQFVETTLAVAADEEEAFWGFGEQFTVFNQRGKLLRLINMEQGIFRGAEPESAALNMNVPGTAGDWWTTYIALPQWLTSSLRSVYFENREPFVADMTASDRILMSGNTTSLTGHILAGNSPGELMTAFTAFTGRMDPLPDWIGKGAVVHVQGGSAAVNPMVEQLINENVSLAGLWVEDWCGTYKDNSTGSVQVQYNWVLDETYYPDWATLQQTAGSVGARLMVYVNPFLIDTPTVAEGGTATRNLYDEANYLGYLVKYNGNTSNGWYYGPYLSLLITRVGAMLDLSNPYAVAWFQQVIAQEVYTKAQASGYMADFGEWLPYRTQNTPGMDVVTYNNRSALSFHNEYTEVWAALHKPVAKLWKNASAPWKNPDPVVMVRTGHLSTPGNAQLMWAGDQTVLWDDRDGLTSALTGMLSGGLSGFSITHSDIGGYAGNGFEPLKFLKICRTKNILMRWAEMNVFSAVFRTHLGNAPNSNSQIFTDEDTMGHFARFAKLFAFMQPYRAKLMLEASTLGYPLMRPLLFHYPADKATWDLSSQFLFGEQLLVAPVLSSTIHYKRTIPIVGKVEYAYASVDVYLPAGNWTRLWHETDVYSSAGQKYQVEVRFGEPAVFYVQGWSYGAELSQFVNQELDSNLPAPVATSTSWNNCV